MELIFQTIAIHIALLLEATSILLISFGALEALLRILSPLIRRVNADGVRRAAWLGLARWLVLGLEFMLAADIVRTVIEPDWAGLGQLAATAVIRTFLNFFLERDLEAAREAVAKPVESS
jgi:uncharacterized membrane protein